MTDITDVSVSDLMTTIRWHANIIIIDKDKNWSANDTLTHALPMRLHIRDKYISLDTYSTEYIW